MTTGSRPTVVVALHDGFYGCGTGAGFANRALLHILVDLLPSEVRLVVLPVYLEPTSREHDTSWYTDTRHLLHAADAEVHPMDNDTAGLIRFGGMGCFRHLVRDTADVLIRRVLPDADPVLILALDAPFLGLAPLLPAEVVPNLVLVPRSTGRIHTPHDRERIAWETYGLLTAAEQGGHVAAISQYMRRHLGSDYQIPDDTLVDLHDGLSPADWHLIPPTTRLLPPPAHEGFLLALGRAQPYKGFDDLLHAVALVGEHNAMPHLVLAAVTEVPEPNSHQRHLAQKIIDLGLSATLLHRFNPDIRRLLAHPALRAIVVPSRAEPFGRIPIEAYAAGAAPVIATTAGGLAEQIIDGKTGFATTPENPVSLATALRRALALTPAERNGMRDQARRFAADRYDHPATVRVFLNRLAPWITPQPAER